jgi:predicted ATP-dependent endonuclease of OLD family
VKIISLTISNFRSYKAPITIKFDDLTVLVGKNDIGKSTILEALDIFFNDGKGIVKLDKSDLNIDAVAEGNKETCLSVVFSELPDEIIIDDSYRTSLREEYLLNQDEQLEVIKKYSNGGTGKVYVKAFHPTGEKCSDLLLKKNSELKTIIQANNIPCDNLSANAMMRKAIWSYYSDRLDLSNVEIDVTKEDAKKIWDKINSYLPTYSLFQADRKNSDGDSEVQDPLKEAVKQILADPGIQQTLSSIAETVNAQLKDVSQRTLDKLREMDPTIARSLNPQIPATPSLKWADVFKNVSITGDQDIPINKRGSGVKRLVLLNFFRAEAERRFNSGDNTGIIYAIEEPETSQHNANQRILIEALKSLSQSDNTQVILTTHSAFMVKHLDFDNLRVVTNNEQGGKEIKGVLPGQLQYPSLNEVNYIAFNEISEEYHDELWAYIEFQKWKNEYKQGKTTRQYIRILDNGSQKTEQKILTEYIRHKIHHPENKNNAPYTLDELKESIDSMRSFIQNKWETSGVWEPDGDIIAEDGENNE